MQVPLQGESVAVDPIRTISGVVSVVVRDVFPLGVGRPDWMA